MKPLFYPFSKTLIALATAVAATIGLVPQAPGQPTPPSTASSALPAEIVPGSPLAEVVKLLQAGVDTSTIRSFILNSQSAFNLDTDEILFLKDVGAPNDLINAMLDRDKALYAASVTPTPAPVPEPTPAPVPAPDDGTPSSPDVAPPSPDVTLDSFNDTLAPYGSWVTVEGYGRCWRPTTVVYDSSWSPYCDRGSWVYTDYGWYWDSDYAWGVTFHYGRWFRSPRIGWCWCPDTVWAPSWVIWRSDEQYCGWAPLPPFAIFTPGIGFLYRGAQVGLEFDFGLEPDCFVFVASGHFCDRHPRSFRVPQQHAAQVFRQTRVVNNYSVNNHTIVNRGIGVERIASAAHRVIEPAQLSTLPNAGRQGWRGEGFQRTLRPAAAYNNSALNDHAGLNFNPGAAASGNGQLRHGPEIHNNQSSAGTTLHRENTGQSGMGTQPGTTLGGHQTESARTPFQRQPGHPGVMTPNEGILQRGALPAQPHPLVPSEPPHLDAHPNNSEPQVHFNNQPAPSPGPAPSQVQPHTPANVPSGAPNNGNNNGANKQNQNH